MSAPPPPSVRISTKFDIWDFNETLVEAVKFWLKSWKQNIAHFTWRHKCVLLLLAVFSRDKREHFEWSAGCWDGQVGINITRTRHSVLLHTHCQSSLILNHVQIVLFYRCTVHFKIYAVHTPTNTQFIKLGNVLKFALKYTLISLMHLSKWPT